MALLPHFWSIALPTPPAWTFLVYRAGYNDVHPNGVQDLKEMKRVRTNAVINVVAQFDSESNKHRATRYLLTKGAKLATDVVGTLGNTNTGDPKNLIDFAAWGIANYPTERYALILWNHTCNLADDCPGRFGRAGSDPRNKVQTYDVLDHGDFADLCQLIKGGAVPQKVKTACDGVLGALAK